MNLLFGVKKSDKPVCIATLWLLVVIPMISPQFMWNIQDVGSYIFLHLLLLLSLLLGMLLYIY